MKETRSVLNSLVACGVALAMVSTLAAQSGDQTAAKVVRLKGAVRYSTGNNVWQPLKLGDVVKPGTAIQTAADSRVDLVLGDASAPVARPVGAAMSRLLRPYAPTAGHRIRRNEQCTDRYATAARRRRSGSSGSFEAVALWT